MVEGNATKQSLVWLNSHSAHGARLTRVAKASNHARLSLVLPPFFFYCRFEQKICISQLPKNLVETTTFTEWRSICKFFIVPSRANRPGNSFGPVLASDHPLCLIACLCVWLVNKLTQPAGSLDMWSFGITLRSSQCRPPRPVSEPANQRPCGPRHDEGARCRRQRRG
jgi:hypothetical protein